ncbi:protein of unknown function DUF1365 [Pseudonocardia dioxanivorans CB1190]|uniref:DUF1365 domain-containing protein n=1 Tax=Pseudonocardia dioxanivorans (strain ATCC 55486 / DSM 44775 / JCM 13855 / CB1190) TaxID=675635 RepID=F4D158_PSEUX|nr:DUF1365 domain-containing protein [Pseudonocardia dioxanivorans]AEA26846.1 protein of unknown function DUF1365 [Pseudonocardia dioxanivorans CB1190]
MTRTARPDAPAATGTVVPAVYDARVRHVRRAPGIASGRSFDHAARTWLVDVDDLPVLPRPLRALARFEARDHLGDPRRTIRENVDGYLATHGIDLRGGRILMLACPRVLGHAVNPLSVFWCHDRGGAPVCAIAEVHNTYGERHCYLLRPDERGRAEADKAFYVSPFLTLDGRYRMRLPVPDERLAIAVTLHQGPGVALAATLSGTRRPPASHVRSLLRHPLATRRTSALIRRHGIALWLRGLPVVPRPSHPSQEGVQ